MSANCRWMWGRMREMRLTKDELDQIGRVVHEALSAWNVAHGQEAYAGWDTLDDEGKASTLESVSYVIAHPDIDAGTQHRQWMEQKEAAGWSYAPVRDNDKKHHPMMVAFEDLPEQEQRKDALLNAIVRALGTDLR